MFRRALYATVAWAFAGSFAATPAVAAGFGLWDQSAYGTGMAYAGMAAGGSLSAMFWNPATLGDVRGFMTESDLSGLLPIAHVDTPLGNQGNVILGAALPASYVGYRINENFIVGLGLNSPFGLASTYARNSGMRNVFGTGLSVAGTSRILTIDANPNIAYQLNEMFTIAAGLQLQYAELQEDSFGLTTGAFRGKTERLGVGYTVGVDLKPMKGTSIGLGYRSGIDNSIDGTLTGFAPFGLSGNLKVKTPGTVSLGLSQQVGDLWTVHAGANYTNWSVLGVVPVSGAAANVVGKGLPFDYKDAWFYSVGAEYKYSHDLTLRSGIGYETSPIDDSNRTYRLPDADRIWLSAGLSYTPATWYSVDAGYSFLHGFGDKLLSAAAGGPASNGPISGSFSANSHIFSLALKMKFGG